MTPTLLPGTDVAPRPRITMTSRSDIAGNGRENTPLPHRSARGLSPAARAGGAVPRFLRRAAARAFRRDLARVAARIRHRAREDPPGRARRHALHHQVSVRAR